jgi:hypothetical protein
MREKIEKILRENSHIYELVYYLLTRGAGVLLPEEISKEKKIQIMAAELEDGLKYKSRDRWHYELAQAVLKKDRKLLREVKKDVELQTEKKVTWQLKIEDWLLELVEKEAKRLGLTKADIVRLALRKYFKLT